MRLPAITPQQIEHEDSRQQHEDWYQAFLEGRRIAYPTTRHECEDERLRLQGNSRGFWRPRGFRIRTEITRDKQSILIWLEVMTQKEQAA